MAEPSSSYRCVEQLDPFLQLAGGAPWPVAAFAETAPWTADCLLLHGKLMHPYTTRVLLCRHTPVTECLCDRHCTAVHLLQPNGHISQDCCITAQAALEGGAFELAAELLRFIIPPEDQDILGSPTGNNTEAHANGMAAQAGQEEAGVRLQLTWQPCP